MKDSLKPWEVEYPNCASQLVRQSRDSMQGLVCVCPSSQTWQGSGPNILAEHAALDGLPSLQGQCLACTRHLCRAEDAGQITA